MKNENFDCTSFAQYLSLCWTGVFYAKWISRKTIFTWRIRPAPSTRQTLLITQIKQQYTSKGVVSGRPGKTRQKPTKWEKSREPGWRSRHKLSPSTGRRKTLLNTHALGDWKHFRLWTLNIAPLRARIFPSRMPILQLRINKLITIIRSTTWFQTMQAIIIDILYKRWYFLKSSRIVV